MENKNELDRLTTWEEIKARLDEPVAWYLWIYYRIRRQLIDIKYWPKEVKWCWQRITRGWSDRDTWSFDYYLSKVIGEGVKRLSEKSAGWPDQNFKTYEEYTAMLRKMSDGFLNYNNKLFDTDESLSDEDIKQLNKSLDLLKKHFQTLWD